jgi:hypothetical protein
MRGSSRIGTAGELSFAAAGVLEAAGWLLFLALFRRAHFDTKRCGSGSAARATLHRCGQSRWRFGGPLRYYRRVGGSWLGMSA